MRRTEKVIGGYRIYLKDLQLIAEVCGMDGVGKDANGVVLMRLTIADDLKIVKIRKDIIIQRRRLLGKMLLIEFDSLMEHHFDKLD